MPIEPINNALWPLTPSVKTYLAAIGAAAIYVSAEKDALPVSVGVARDLDKALGHLRRIVSPTLGFRWIAWAPDYNGLIGLSRMPDLLYGERLGVKTALPLDHIVRRIELTARENGIALTPHYKAIERASDYAEQLDSAIAAMQNAGMLKTFNQAYRAHRLRQGRHGESTAHYFVVMAGLRSIIVRLLVANQFSHDAALEEIRKRFPWFSRFRPNGRRTKILTDWKKRNSRA